MPSLSPPSPTQRGRLVSKEAVNSSLKTLWAVSHTFLYGFAITSLNGIQDSVMCRRRPAAAFDEELGLSSCLAMTSSQFGLVVSVFTLGGLAGSLVFHAISQKFGKTGSLRVSALSVLIGSAVVGLAGNALVMGLGRILVGFGSGISTACIPLFLAEIAPPAIKQSLGIMNQLSIVAGMCFAQSLSFPFSEPGSWRLVFVSPVVIALAQLCGSLLVMDKDDLSESTVDEEEGLGSQSEENLSLRELILSRDEDVVRSFHVVVASQMSQQICGVAPVMYFSTRILSPVFQGKAKLLALFVVLIKLPITMIPAFLIQKLGSRKLLVYPTSMMCIAALCLALGINTDASALSIVAIVLFVVSFSVGLGPVTWVVLPEVMPHRAVTAAGSVGLGLNWLCNFGMGSIFLPLQERLSKGGTQEGNIFYVLAATCLVSTISMAIAFRRRDRILLQ
ncbi:hypothetical protein L198_00724 [Cryptococcus wingfieldii CBS 7118]|uniref:Major facilitator superfamily (MFS) profile domain-containing protein n=1 Tax=Cryptococcus wingfieldii CBS 7118 TaxID=1295528 RepID=A0A1E3K278_9TREE|nr:hypothetical protein L198_00724 [Cryptococcus wingfieldii CBS 7118]ODO07145.1 hypothetical protein L198_00724 [Cryptococcus wingfieldii CBS 7118]